MTFAFRLFCIALAFIGSAGVFAAGAEAQTCFGSGERSSGMNKICYYDCLGSEASKTVGSTELCPLSVQSNATQGQQGLGSSRANSGFTGGTTCFHQGEYVSGMNKVCRYDCLGSPAETTISSVSLCPLTVNR